MSKLYKNIVNGALSLTVAAFFVKIVGVLYKIPLMYIIGEEGMGYFNTAYVIYGFFYILCSGGIPKAITCIISEAESRDRENTDYLIYKKALRLLSVFALIIFASYLILSPLISKLIGNTRALATMIAISPTIFFVTVSGVIRGYLCSRKKLLPVSLAQVLEAVFKLVLGLIMARVGMAFSLRLELVSAMSVLGITIGSVASFVLLYIWAENTNKSKKAGQSFITKENLTYKILKIALPITIGTSILNVGNIFDASIILRGLTGSGFSIEEANIIYGNFSTLAVPMLNLVISLVTPLTVTLLPELINVKGNTVQFSEKIDKVVFLTTFIVAPCSAVFLIYSFDLLDVLFSSSAAANGFDMLCALSFGTLFLSLLNVFNTALEAKGRFYAPIISLSAVTATKLIFSYIFTAKTDLGYLGVPIGSTASYLVGLFISLIILSTCKVKIKLLINSVIPTILAFVSYLLPYIFLFRNGIIFGSTLHLFIVLFISTLIYLLMCALSYYIVIKPSDKKILKQKSSLFTEA